MKKGDIVKTVEGTQATVQWVHGTEVSVIYEDQSCGFVQVTDLTLVEACPVSFQSSVEHMPIEELQSQIERLRSKRTKVPKAKTTKTRVTKDNSPVAQMIAGLSADDRFKLMQKMGMTE